MSSKRMVVIADLHCGSATGLTPPAWNKNDSPGHLKQKNKKTRNIIWDWFASSIRKLQPIDILVVNGDAITGKEPKSCGTELLEPELSSQVDMAVECIEVVKAKKIVMTYGTAYHVSDAGEDWELQVAHKVEAVKIGAHEWIDINGKVFDFKHHVGSSSVPYGRGTAPTKDALWNMIWAEAQMQPKADYIIRSHVHYCVGSFFFNGEKQVWAMTTPALQGMGTKFGSRRCSGTVDTGFLVFDIDDKGGVTWRPEIVLGVERKAQTLRL